MPFHASDLLGSTGLSCVTLEKLAIARSLSQLMTLIQPLAFQTIARFGLRTMACSIKAVARSYSFPKYASVWAALARQSASSLPNTAARRANSMALRSFCRFDQVATVGLVYYGSDWRMSR